MEKPDAYLHRLAARKRFMIYGIIAGVLMLGFAAYNASYFFGSIGAFSILFHIIGYKSK